MRTLSSLLIGLSIVTFGACADEQGRGYLLRHATITLSQATRIAETSESGRAIRAELKQSGTRVFYEIEILDSTDRSRQVRVDADTGKIFKNLALP